MANIKFIQNAGLGDIMFLEPIARQLYLEGHEIYWDTVDIYADTEDYIPYINWNVKKDSYDKEYNFQFLKMADYNCRIMEAKYQYGGLPFETWKTFNYNRDFGKEQALIKILKEHIPSYEKFDITKPYRLIHNEYATYQECNINIEENPDILNIYIQPIEGFSLFDWSTIIEHATEIHAVSTSSLFLFEKLELFNNPELCLYARHNDPELYETKYLTSKNWKFINYTG